MSLERKFLILSHDTQTKKIVFPQYANMNFIANEVEAKFEIQKSDCHLQYFDNDVAEWIDLENLEEIEIDRILKVKVIKLKRKSTLEETQSNNGRISPTDTPSTSSALTPSTSSALTPSTSSTGTPSTSSAGTPSTSSAGITRPPSPLTPLSRPTSPAVSSSPISSVRNDRKIWPRIYFFPVQTIPQGLRLKLDSQQPLERVDRTRLLDVIYTDVTQYENGLYPSQELYDQIVDGLLRQYPYLIKISGVPLQSVRVYWKEKLKYKWGNERKSRDKHLPEVQARKRKKETAPNPENISGGKVYLTWSMANFLPAQPESEDDTAISLHCDWLKREFIKTDQNEALINLKMNLTFAARRKAVVEGTISAAELVDQYPFLKDRRQILMEFTRLGPNGKDDRLEDVFYSGLDKFAGPIVSLTKSKKLIPQVKEVVDQIVLLRTEGERKYASQCIAVTSCATLFKEKIEKILFFPGQDSSVSPIALIVCDKLLTMDSNSFELKIDNNTIFSCDTFIELITGFMAAIYCFNLAYPKPVSKTLTFLKNVFLNLNDAGKIDKKIVSVVTDLNRERQKNM